MKKNCISTATLLSLLLLCACNKNDHPDLAHIFRGPAVAIGKGTGHSWIETDNNGRPKTIGIMLESKALTGLPAGHHVKHAVEHEYLLPLHSKKSITPFDHIAINWNPEGHPPAHIYDKPHFDFHFYMMKEADRTRIPAYEVDSTGFLNYPAPAYLPPTYFPIPGGEAKMGVHWADATSPELDPNQPQPFTQTFIYGSYNGKVTYYEPMATLQFLSSLNHFTRNIPQPQRFKQSGYYPTKISYTQKNKAVHITLYDFVFRQGQ